MPATTINVVNILELLSLIPFDPIWIDILKLAIEVNSDDTPNLFNLLVARRFIDVNLQNISDRAYFQRRQSTFTLERIRTYKSEYIENITQSAKLANEIVKFIEKTNGPRELFDENGYIDSIENLSIKQKAITWYNSPSI